MLIVNTLIQRYGLEPHPEGGWYKQTYKSNEQIASEGLPKRFVAGRVFSTAIYFYWGKEIFPPFTVLKVMSAGIFMQGIHYLFI